jgi:hypothetical protein
MQVVAKGCYIVDAYEIPVWKVEEAESYVRNDSDTRTFSIFIKEKYYACLSSSSRLEYRLFVRAAVFLWIVLVQEILSRRPQTLRYSVSAVATSFAVIASKNALD